MQSENGGLPAGPLEGFSKLGFSFVGKENKSAMRECGSRYASLRVLRMATAEHTIAVFDRALAVRRARSASLTDKDSKAMAGEV